MGSVGLAQSADMFQKGLTPLEHAPRGARGVWFKGSWNS